MNEVHVCTNLSMAAGSPIFKGTCQVCLRETELAITYVGEYCHLCGHIVSFEDISGSILMKQRELLKIKRPDMAYRYGVGTKTLHNYEWGWNAPKKYRNYLANLIHAKEW